MGHTPEPWRAEWQPGQTPKHTYTHCVMYGDDSLCDTLTKADAERIVACVNACTGMADPAGEIQRLRAERDRYEKAYAELTNAATRNGFVDSHGHIRKLLPASSGPTLYVTTDGCIVGNPTAIIYAFEMHPGCRFSGKIITMKYETWFATKWDDDLPVHWADNSPDRVWGCYSTRESAENAAALSANEADAPASKNTRSAYELKSSTSLRSVMDKAKEAE